MRNKKSPLSIWERGIYHRRVLQAVSHRDGGPGNVNKPNGSSAFSDKLSGAYGAALFSGGGVNFRFFRAM